MKCEETRELVTALVDGELSHQERADIEAHLDGCPKCRWVYGQEKALKREVHKVGVSTSVPAELKRKILADYRAAPTEGQFFSEWKKVLLWFRPFVRPSFGLAILVLGLAPLIYVLRQHGEPVSIAALEIQQKVVAGKLPLQTAHHQNALRDWQIRAVHGKFAPMGYYLSSMHFQPAGGLVQDVNDRRVLVTVFNRSDASVTCFTFLGTEEDAPKDAARVFDPEKKINFYTFSRDGYNAVLHREGDVICILVSTIPAEELLDLARIKPHHT